MFGKHLAIFLLDLISGYRFVQMVVLIIVILEL